MKIVVTGASGGIGKEIVKHLSRMGGNEIIAISRSQDLLDKLKQKCLEDYDTNIIAIASDFQEAGFQNKIATEINSHYNGIDCLINNAGLLINKSFKEQNKVDLYEQLRVNFEAPLLLTQALMSMLIESEGKAHVVNIGSMGGFQGSQKFPGLSVYSATKGALAILTECLAAEYAEEDVAFNCLALGSADTEMLRKAFPGYISSMSPKKIAEYIVDFSLKAQHFYNGKVLPVAGLST